MERVVVFAGLSLLKALGAVRCGSYRECAEAVSRAVAEELGVAEVSVAPNVYGSSFRQESPGLGLYFNYVYKRALDVLEELGPSEVHLDLSHGVNYMPALAKDAVRLAVYAYVTSSRREVRLAMYNSDPYEPGAARLYVHRVWEESVGVPAALSALLTPFLDRRNAEAASSLARLEEIYGGCSDMYRLRFKTYRLAQAAASGVYLYLKAVEDYVSSCFKALDGYLSRVGRGDVEVEVRDGEVVYKSEAPELLAYLHAFYKAIYSVLQAVRRCDCRTPGFVDVGCLGGVAATYYVNHAVRAVVQNEVRKLLRLKDAAKRKRGAALLGELLYGDFDSAGLCRPKPRNLVAHAGFADAAAFLLYEDDALCASYRPSPTLDCTVGVEKALDEL
ncbi:MAG: TM1812 family CRISPR-associated protein [Thermoproteus sp.]